MGKDSMFAKVFFMHRPGLQPRHSVFVSVFLVSPLHLSNIAHSGLIGFGCHITQSWMKAESCSYACHLKPPGSTRIIKNSHRGNRCDNGTWQIALPNLWRLVTRVCKAAKRQSAQVVAESPDRSEQLVSAAWQDLMKKWNRSSEIFCRFYSTLL